MSRRRISKVAVIGSGIMGSGIACHFANIGVDVLLLDIAPNELNEKDAALLIRNGCICVGEGANMPSTPEAIHQFTNNNILSAPGEASCGS